MDKRIDISGRYDEEISEINYILQGLYDERVYGLNGNNSRMDGSLQHNVIELTKKLNCLMTKIEYGQASKSDDLAESLFIVHKDDRQGYDLTNNIGEG